MTRVVAGDDLDVVVAELVGGAIVAVPTDTVYGVAASVHCPDAVRRLYSLKGRPTTVPLPVLVADAAQLGALGVRFSPRERAVTDRLWPGPLTIVTGTTSELARLVGSPDGRVGFRVPRHRALAALLGRTGPLAVTSANAHGEPPSRDVDEVLAIFGSDDVLAAVLDGGRCDGTVSTVARVTEESVVVLRHGALSADAIEDAARTGDDSTGRSEPHT